MNPYRDFSDNDPVALSHLTYSNIAAKLLQDHFLLTALEFHTELVESGRELPQLREFFSNPGNFEQHVSRNVDVTPTIPRTPSQATLDSLDFARLSEDGGAGGGGFAGPGTGSSGTGQAGVNEIAVLEFELRKARDTINALRANLTQAAEYELIGIDKNNDQLIFLNHNVKAHEQRALNFLINEYLLTQDYKLTSITFSDENPNQDFDNWDDVGLNLPRPMSLISLYRGERVDCHKSSNSVLTQTEFASPESVECQVNLDVDKVERFCPKCHMELYDNDVDKWTNELPEVIALKEQILALEMEKLNFQRLYDTAVASLNSLSSPSSEVPNSDVTIYQVQHQPKPPHELGNSQNLTKYQDNIQPITHIADENYYGSNSSTNSGTPDQFEMIGSETMTTGGRAGSNTSSFEPATFMSESSYNGKALDAISAGTGAEENVKTDVGKIHKQSAWMEGLPTEYSSALLSWCGVNNHSELPPASPGSDLLMELLNVNQPTWDTLLHIIGASLPRIVSQMSVSRRGEALAIAVVSAHLAVSSSAASGQTLTRKLLHLLLGLYKKPSADEMKTVIAAITLLLNWGAANEDPSLSSCSGALAALCCIAELLGGESGAPGGGVGLSRSLLAANVCLAAAQVVPLELLSSLVFSITQSMCESSEPEIRLFGLRCAVLACPTVTADKYQQFENLLFMLCDDSDNQISTGSVDIFLPVLARSALHLGKLHDRLCAQIFSRFLKSSFKEDSKKCQSTAFNIKILSTILPVVLVHVARRPIVQNHVDSSKHATVRSDGNILLDLNNIATATDVDMYSLVGSFYDILESQPNLSWSEKDWLNDIFINKLVRHIREDASCELEDHIVSYIELFNNILRTFSVHAYKSVLYSDVVSLKRDMANFGSCSIGAMVLVSVYIATVLPTDADEELIQEFIKSWCECFAMSGQNIQPMLTPVKWLSFNRTELTDCIVRALADVVNHSNEHVRSFGALLVSGMVNPQKAAERDKLSKLCAKLELTVFSSLNDSSPQVLLSIYPALGYLLCLNGGSRAAWGAMVSAAEKAVSNITSEAGHNVCHIAQILTNVMLHSDEDTVYEKVLPILCMICNSPLMEGSLNKLGSSALLGSLLPAMQLATQSKSISDQFNRETLLPALRKLQSFDAQLGNDHKSSVDALIYRTSSQQHTPTQSTGTPRTASAPAPHPTNTAHIAETMGRRMTQMLHNSKPAMNLHNIFKKKT